MSSEQRGPDRVLTLTQQKFCANGKKVDDTLWMVPITISTQEQPSEVINCVFWSYQQGYLISLSQLVLLLTLLKNKI